jgi:hypothetical protein
MKAALFLLFVTLTVMGSERLVLVAGDDTTVTFRERLPDHVALDPASGVYHFAGCPSIRPGMERTVIAAATLRGLRSHCSSLRKTVYTTSRALRAPRDPNVISVLFLGNSLTYFNEIPRMTAVVASAEKRPLRVDAVTRSGVTLEQLWNDDESRKKLWTQHWDYVVLQGGAGAAHPLYNAESFNRYLALFAEDVRRSGAVPLLYLVARPKVDHEAFIAASFEAARRANVRVAPVGVAWREVSALRRLDQDGLHPNAFGAYLVACTVFSTIYDRPAHGTAFDFRNLALQHENYDDALREQTISAEDARRIQDAAWRAVQSAKKR